MSRDLARRLLPFLGWPRVDGKTLYIDLVAGISAALLASMVLRPEGKLMPIKDTTTSPPCR